MSDTVEKKPSAEVDDYYADLADQPDVPLNVREGAGEPYERIFKRRLARRDFLQGATGVAATVAVATLAPVETADASWWRRRRRRSEALTFKPIEGSNADAIVLPQGYEYDTIIRWGDSLSRHVPDLETDDIENGALLHPDAGAQQAMQFGYNCDAVEFFPLIPGTEISGRGFVCCNHEYTQPEMKYPNWPLYGTEIPVDDDANETRPETPEETNERIKQYVQLNPQIVDVELAAHGISVVRVARLGGRWTYFRGSPFNRRITGETPIELTGPAAGDPLLQTHGDPTGTIVNGTLNNCAGGQTPWGTYLSAEENVDQYFGNFDAYADPANNPDPDVLDAHARLPLPGSNSNRGWEFAKDRFDVKKEPKEALRFGWIVELDPYDPHSTPKKRTACGRFKHECATTILSTNNHCVVYSGDDARDEYMYKFVSEGRYNPRAPRSRAMDLLDTGTLYAARLNEDGTGEWLPLIWGQNGLTKKNGFENQSEVLIKARKAADILGATPMDRPEDFEANPVTKKVYCALTNNTRRQSNDPDGKRNAQGRQVSSFPFEPNPRGPNRYGHILEITEAHNDNAAIYFTWDILLLAGDPETTIGDYLTDLDNVQIPPTDVSNVPDEAIDLSDNPSPEEILERKINLKSQETVYFGGLPQGTQISPIGSPDNVGFDNKGNIWIITDGSQPRGANNGGFACPTEGPERGKVKQFMSGPVACEVCGGEFTPDNRTLFLNIQHPGAVFAQAGLPTLENPSSYWPDSTIDGGRKKQPRPSLLAVKNGRWGFGRIGE